MHKGDAMFSYLRKLWAAPAFYDAYHLARLTATG
jgi:hypothetical protein